MAYLAALPYDDTDNARTLDGMGAVAYDNGTRRNLSGSPLAAVKYDDGGGFRRLGLGQFSDLPFDLPLAPAANVIPLNWYPPTPSPIVDTTWASIPGQLVDTTPPLQPTIYTPLYNPQTQSAPITGTLTPPVSAPSSAGTLVSLAAPVTNVLTSIFNSIKTAVSGTPSGGTTLPSTSAAAAAAPSSSWFTAKSVISGVPNWGIVAVGGVAALALLGAGKSGGRRRNPVGRRRNGMELVLMGANPAFKRKPHWIKRKKRQHAIRRQLRSMGVKIPRSTPAMSQLSMYELRRLRRQS